MIGKLGFVIHGTQYTFEMDSSELPNLISQLEKIGPMKYNETPVESNTFGVMFPEKTDVRETHRVTISAIKDYILSKPMYSYTFYELMLQFYGRIVRVDQDPNPYKALNRKAKIARKEIEREKHGKFEQEWIDTRIDGKRIHTRQQTFVADPVRHVLMHETGQASDEVTVTQR